MYIEICAHPISHCFTLILTTLFCFTCFTGHLQPLQQALLQITQNTCFYIQQRVEWASQVFIIYCSFTILILMQRMYKQIQIFSSILRNKTLTTSQCRLKLCFRVVRRLSARTFSWNHTRLHADCAGWVSLTRNFFYFARYYHF